MKSLVIKTLLFINYILIILFMGKTIAELSSVSIQVLVPFFLATLFLADITYIASCNIKENNILFLFCGLLAADSWYLLFASTSVNINDVLFRLFSPVIIYLSIKFCFLFAFQGYKYKYKKATDLLMIILCIGAISSVFFSEKIYACTYGIQFVVSILCFIYIILCHWKRIIFVVRNEKTPILLSLSITMILFLIYYFTTVNIKDHIGNFGIYIVVLIFSMSIHGIVLKQTDGIPLSSIFSLKQQLIFGVISAGLLCSVCFISASPILFFILMLNILLALLFLFNIILNENLKCGNNTIIQNSNYIHALNKLQHEEGLKAEFANFLHDEILQDLLSVKNMLGKSNRPEIQDLLYKTLGHLNIRIRNQMQDYHPVILKTLSMKENLDHLIESISAIFPQRKIKVSFECSDTIFIAKPYDMLIYRLVKELLTNVYKHSDGDHAWITLTLEKDLIKLYVCDNGIQNTLFDSNKNTASVSHKGIFSIKEQIVNLGGSLSISHNVPQGVRIEIQLLMKGDDSYQHFIS